MLSSAPWRSPECSRTEKISIVFTKPKPMVFSNRGLHQASFTSAIGTEMPRSFQCCPFAWWISRHLQDNPCQGDDVQLSSDLSVAVGPVLHPPLLPLICKIDKVLTLNAAKAEVSWLRQELWFRHILRHVEVNCRGIKGSNDPIIERINIRTAYRDIKNVFVQHTSIRMHSTTCCTIGTAWVRTIYSIHDLICIPNHLKVSMLTFPKCDVWIRSFRPESNSLTPMG